MKAIKFKKTELAFMRDFYETELADAKAYVKKIKKILKKIRKNDVVEESIMIEAKKGRAERKSEVLETKEPKKRGRKPKSVEPTVETISVPEPMKSEEGIKIEVKEQKKRGRKPKAVIPPIENISFAVVEPEKIEEIMEVEPKPNKKTTSKVKSTVERKPAAKPALKKIQVEKVEPNSTPLQNPSPKRVTGTVIKKQVSKKRSPKGTVTLTRLSKPLQVKETKVESSVESTSEVEPQGSKT